MICQKCHKNMATMRYAEVIKGKVSDRMICQECYARIERGESPGFEIAGAAPSPNLHRGRFSRSDTVVRQDACPTCGHDVQELLDRNVMGCSACYVHFSGQAEAQVRALQGSLQHRGKSPGIHAGRERIRADLQTKRALLRSAVQSEHYEDAADLRDEIRELETVIETTSAGAAQTAPGLEKRDS
jgi:protein arginine kinase activator